MRRRLPKSPLVRLLLFTVMVSSVAITVNTAIESSFVKVQNERLLRGGIGVAAVISVLVVSLPLLGSSWAASRARRRRQAGLCPTCAYDLRGHAPGQSCPECGTRILSPEPRDAL